MIGTIIAKKKVYIGYRYLNKCDVNAFMSYWADDAVFVFPGTVSASGTIKGKKAVEQWFKNFCIQFPEIHFKINKVCSERIFDLIGTNILTAEWELDLTNKNGKSIHNSGVTVINLKRGKITHAQDFIFNTGKEFNKIWGKSK